MMNLWWPLPVFATGEMIQFKTLINIYIYRIYDG